MKKILFAISAFVLVALIGWETMTWQKFKRFDHWHLSSVTPLNKDPRCWDNTTNTKVYSIQARAWEQQVKKKAAAGHKAKKYSIDDILPSHQSSNEATLAFKTLLVGQSQRAKIYCRDQSTQLLALSYPIWEGHYDYHLMLPAACLQGRGGTIEFNFAEDVGLSFESVSLRVLTFDDAKKEKNVHPIEGYNDKISYATGESVQVMVHAPEGQFDLEVISLEENQTVLKAPNLQGQAQDYPARAYKIGAGWQLSFTFTIGADWPSGYYAVKLTDQTNKPFLIYFVVHPTRPQDTANVLVIASTFTWRAYNPWDDKSLYRTDYRECLLRPHESFASDKRPDTATPTAYHLGVGEVRLTRWLRKNSISYSLYSMHDFQQNLALLEQTNIVMLNRHNEYWTQEQYNALKLFKKRGGSIISLSGNTIYGRVTYKNDTLELRSNQQVNENDHKQGGHWRDLQQDEAALLGVAYTNPGIDTYAPYKVLEPTHWIFSGTGLKNGDLFGDKLGEFLGASGGETDKINKFSPKNTVLLAKGTNPDKGGAEMVFYEDPVGGAVFSVGSISFTDALEHDSITQKMLLNVLQNFRSRYSQ